jgi:succinate-semialdehyde dehydrogenase / glutarate-semialdehyde dehydrogenase
VCLENGGNAPFIIFDDADLDNALRALMAAKFRNAGQACIAANRIYVQAGVYDKFADMLTKSAEGMKCGNGLHDGVTMGPLINQAGLDKVDRQVKDCLAKGATLRTGGAPHAELNRAGGFFYQPTVLTGVTEAMQPFLEETFGPVAPLCKFTSEEDVIHLANNTR